MALALDRKAFIDILTEGKADVGGAMLPPPDGVWGMPPEMLQDDARLRPDVEKNRAEARKIMERLGYGPDKPLKIKVSTRNIAIYRDPAVILIDQLKKIYIDARARADRHHASGTPRSQRKDYSVGLNLTGSRRRRSRRQNFYENYRLQLGAQLHELLQPRDRGADRRAVGRDATSRSARRWCGRSSGSCRRTWRGRSSCTTSPGTCWQPTSRASCMQHNSIYNGWRFEDVWLDK